MSNSLDLTADQQQNLDVCLRSLEQHGRHWKCTLDGCDRDGYPLENSTFALKHFAAVHLGWKDIPKALLTSYCPFCEKTGFRSDIIKHMEVNHVPGRYETCERCEISSWDINMRTHPPLCAAQVQLSRWLRTWNPRLLRYECANEKLAGLLVVQPSRALAEAVDHNRDLRISLDQLRDQLKQRRDEAAAAWRRGVAHEKRVAEEAKISRLERRYAEIEKEISKIRPISLTASLSKSAYLLSARHRYVYFPPSSSC